MSTQRNDKSVARDAARFNETTRSLRRGLRKAGIRNPHTSRKAQELIRRAATGRPTYIVERRHAASDDGAFRSAVKKGMLNGLSGRPQAGRAGE